MDVAVRVVVQARMGSTRLPGKTLKRLSGRTVLEHVVHRLQATADFHRGPWDVRVATTTNPEDDQTAEACRALSVHCFRGDAQDVLSRYLGAIDDLPPYAVVVRATADNPVYCPRRTAAIVREHLDAEADYTGVKELSCSVPEVFQAGALRHMAKLATDAYQREHVTPFFRQFPWSYRVRLLPLDWHGLRFGAALTLDTPADYDRLSALFADLAAGNGNFTLEDAYAWLERRSSLTAA